MPVNASRSGSSSPERLEARSGEGNPAETRSFEGNYGLPLRPPPGITFPAAPHPLDNAGDGTAPLSHGGSK